MTNQSEYEAFAAEAHIQRRLRIELASGLNHTPNYSYLVDIIDDAPRASHVALIFSQMVVNITGKNLQQLIALLQEDKVKRITEFSIRRHFLSVQNAAIITKIEVFERRRRATKPSSKKEQLREVAPVPEEVSA